MKNLSIIHQRNWEADKGMDERGWIKKVFFQLTLKKCGILHLYLYSSLLHTVDTQHNLMHLNLQNTIINIIFLLHVSIYQIFTYPKFFFFLLQKIWILWLTKAHPTILQKKQWKSKNIIIIFYINLQRTMLCIEHRVKFHQNNYLHFDNYFKGLK